MKVAFAFVMLFEIREEDVELLHTETLCSDIMYGEMSQHTDEIFDQLERLKLGQGFWHVHGIGYIEFGQNEGPDGLDPYEEVHVTSEHYAPASEGEMHLLADKVTGLQWPLTGVQLEKPAPSAFFSVTKEDYAQHNHQHAINQLLFFHPEFSEAASTNRYKPAHLRMMADAHIRGLVVDLKTGSISLPQTKE